MAAVEPDRLRPKIHHIRERPRRLPVGSVGPIEKQGDEPGRSAEPFHEQGQTLVYIDGLRAAVELPHA